MTDRMKSFEEVAGYVEDATLVVLSTPQMEEIHEAIVEAAGSMQDDPEHTPLPSSAALQMAWPMIVGDEVWAALEPGDLNPALWAIPEWQWKQIAEWLLEAIPASAIGRVNYALDWMNWGPSGSNA